MAKVDHQFSLFGFQPPSRKVPISKEKIEQAKKFLEQRNGQGVIQCLRDVNDSLERFERRLK